MGKNIISKLILGVIVLYLFATFTVFTPLYNWQYAKENGFIKWLIFGEIIATAKAFIWPYYTFFAVKTNDSDRYWTAEDKNSNRHYTNSKKACDEALKLIIKVGDVSRLGLQQSQEVIDLFKLAIAEANMVTDSFLKKVHPIFCEKYTQEYKSGLQTLLDGLESKNQVYILGGSYGYNEFAEWTKANANNLKFPD